MKCFSWNVRDLNGKTRKLDVQRWIRTNRPSIGSLLETRVKQENLDSLIMATFPGWSFDSNHSLEANNGRIVVIWNPMLSVITYMKTPQLLVCAVFNPSSQEYFYCSVCLRLQHMRGAVCAMDRSAKSGFFIYCVFLAPSDTR